MKQVISKTTCSALTEIIHSKSLEHTGGVSDKERSLIVGDGDDQGAAQADHQVRHSEAEDENVYGLEERRVPQHHGDGETVVEDRQHGVDEHEEREDAVAHPGEDGGSHGHGLDGWRLRAPGRAVAVHAVSVMSSFVKAESGSADGSAQDTAEASVLSFLICIKTQGCTYFPDCAPAL